MDECCRKRHLWTTLAEHVFEVGARHARRLRPVEGSSAMETFVVAAVWAISRTHPGICWKVRFHSRSDTAVITGQ